MHRGKETFVASLCNIDVYVLVKVGGCGVGNVASLLNVENWCCERVLLGAALCVLIGQLIGCLMTPGQWHRGGIMRAGVPGTCL